MHALFRLAILLDSKSCVANAPPKRDCVRGNDKHKTAKTKISAYLLKLLDGTLVNTTALVDQMA